MQYLVEMLRECEKIADLKKKIQVDPPNTKQFESAIWAHYDRVTKLNDAYYDEKASLVPEISDCHITFRSMEGKARAFKTYDITLVQRFVV